ncbi:hypothetical protein MPER_09256 [Moniliophthora perniciosa FA553]|nr:hypothetical protein MPER_09256 [Moniliophthora perniciosa FA553]
MASKAESAAVTHYLQFYIQWASITVLWYDYALTFPMEVKYMWGTKPRLSTALYVCCRHALITNILYLLAVANLLGDTHVYSKDTFSCNTWYKSIAALSFFGRSAVIALDVNQTLLPTRHAVTFTARTYAIFGRNKWILAYLSALGVVCMALHITHIPGLRCVGSSSIHMLLFGVADTSYPSGMQIHPVVGRFLLIDVYS